MTISYAALVTLVGPVAYVGPGPGLTMLATLFGMLGMLAIALWTVALWPLRAMLRRRRAARGEARVVEFSDERLAGGVSRQG